MEFRWGNLAQPEFLAGEPPFEVVFCRNVLIYFHAEARRMAVGHLHRLLSPDGLLCSAPAEARIFSEAGFRSLGSECPFAFRHQDNVARSAAGRQAAHAAIRRRPAASRRSVCSLPTVARSADSRPIDVA